MCDRNHRHSIFCVVPPYMLRAIMANGSAAQREAAIATLAGDATFRSLRAVTAASSSLEARRKAAIPTPPNKQRLICTAQNQEWLPGQPARAEGQGASGDREVDEAYDGLGATFDYFLDNHGRNSIDDSGRALLATVHYGTDYTNAFWNSRQMVFGDGGLGVFEPFTRSLDVIGHELGHAVTEDETGLVYMFQPGALNEHLSDVWGSLIKQWAARQTVDQADWLIGAELLSPGVQGRALRSMSAPGSAFDDPILGRDPQPGHMDDYVDTMQDNGGVHINSGIPNRAFYLAAMAIGGHAWEKTGKIWYETVRDPRVTENTSFSDFARVTIDVAGRLSGATGGDVRAVSDAWAEVGVKPS